MASTDAPGQLLDACETYHRDVALAHLDTPPGTARQSRLAAAVVEVQPVCSIPTLKEFSSLSAQPSDAEGTSRQRLSAWGLGMHVQHRLAPAWHTAQSRLQGAACYIGEETLPLRQGFGRMAAERRRDQREIIESAVLAQLGNVNEGFEAYFEEHRRVAADLDFHSVDALWGRVAGFNPATQQDAVAEFLDETREMYLDLLTWAVRQRLRITPSQLRRHDVLAMFTFDEYQHYYQPDVLVPALQACCRHMGLDAQAQGRLAWRQRPAHFGPPEAIALQVPGDVILAYSPFGGVKNAELGAGALGRALMWAHTNAELPLAHRLLADPAVTEGNAQLFANLVAHPDWLRHYLAVWAGEDYRLWRRLDRLYRLRRQLGRFLFTHYLYTADSLAGAAETYREIMMEACCVDYAPEYFLLDVDWHYDSLAPLWSQGMALLLLENLNRMFSADWFRNPESGAWLRQYWSSAMGKSAPELLHLLLPTSEWTTTLFAEMLAEERQ